MKKSILDIVEYLAESNLKEEIKWIQSNQEKFSNPGIINKNFWEGDSEYEALGEHEADTTVAN